MNDALTLAEWPGAEARVFNAGAAFPDNLLLPVQTHTACVRVIGDTVPDLSDTDGLVTCRPDIWIGVRTADCVPVVLYAPDIRAVSAVHAGWKGTLGRIAAEAVAVMKEAGADVSEIKAAFGPHICGECYEVGAELATRFRQNGFGDSVMEYSCRPEHLDLEKANRTALLEAGLSRKNIIDSKWCTLHTVCPVFPSWRRKPGITERLITAVRLL